MRFIRLRREKCRNKRCHRTYAGALIIKPTTAIVAPTLPVLDEHTLARLQIALAVNTDGKHRAIIGGLSNEADVTVYVTGCVGYLAFVNEFPDALDHQVRIVTMRQPMWRDLETIRVVEHGRRRTKTRYVPAITLVSSL